MGKALLTLSALEPDRDFIVINEKSYFLRGDEELSIKQLARVRGVALKIAGLGTEETSEEDAGKIEEQVDAMLDLIIMDFPAEVRDKLTPGQKLQIMRVFTAAAVRRQIAAAGKNQTTGD
jgi:hypothetical protein